MATVDSQILQLMNAILTWAECSNVNNHTIDRLAIRPLSDTVNVHAFLMYM